MFINNSVAQNGGVFYLQHSNFAINDNSQVVFTNNSANSGVVYLYYHSDISSNNSLIEILPSDMEVLFLQRSTPP